MMPVVGAPSGAFTTLVNPLLVPRTLLRAWASRPSCRSPMGTHRPVGCRGLRDHPDRRHLVVAAVTIGGVHIACWSWCRSSGSRRWAFSDGWRGAGGHAVEVVRAGRRNLARPQSPPPVCRPGVLCPTLRSPVVMGSGPTNPGVCERMGWLPVSSTRARLLLLAPRDEERHVCAGGRAGHGGASSRRTEWPAGRGHARPPLRGDRPARRPTSRCAGPGSRRHRAESRCRAPRPGAARIVHAETSTGVL